MLQLAIILEYLAWMLTDFKEIWAVQYLYFTIHCLIVAIIYNFWEFLALVLISIKESWAVQYLYITIDCLDVVNYL